MIDLKQFKGFAIQSNDNSIEANRLLLLCFKYDIPLLKINNHKIPCPTDYVPCGSVEWCSKSLNIQIIPDYYPAFLQSHLHRKVWKSSEWILDKKLFIKPSDRYKRFSGFVTTGTYWKKKKPPFWYSEIVAFKNEWRYYISGGDVLCAGWYIGDISEPEPPKLNIEFPKDYFGAVDFGILDTGEFALVEANHPFACGNYTENNNEAYYQWLIDGWKYMLKKNNEIS